MTTMLRGFHVIFSTYGFWLPNDPRGAWSDFVRRWELVRFGRATKVNTRASVAEDAHDYEARRAAKLALKYPEVQFTGRQAQAVGHGFGRAVAEADYLIHACSILPQHVHMVLGPHKRDIRRIVGHLKRGRRNNYRKTDCTRWRLFMRPMERYRRLGAGIAGWCFYLMSRIRCGRLNMSSAIRRRRASRGSIGRSLRHIAEARGASSAAK